MVRHVFSVTSALLLLLLSALSWPAQADLQYENLLVPMPKGFALGWKHPHEDWQEFVQPPETVEDWSTMITVQIFHRLHNINPDTFAGQLAIGWNKGCPGGSSGKATEGNENGYPIVIWNFLCPLNPATKKPEIMFFKGISGADSFYVLQYALRGETTTAVAKPAMEFLRQAVVCDTRRADRPCAASLR